MAKKWYKSRTVWANLIAVGALVAQAAFGFEVTPEEAAAVLVIVNLGCRVITNEPLEA